MKRMKFRTKITLFYSYFDYKDRLSTKSILNIFQDVASIHGEELGVGYQAMLNKNLYWVLSRIKIDIIKMPEVNQTVIVETWPHQKGRIDFDRDLKITSEDGELLIIGTSKWCVIDTVKRMLQRTDNVNYTGEYCLDVNYPNQFDKINLPENNLNLQFSHNVQISDLDHNKHMNNTNYANLVLNAVENKTYTHFEINFKNECVLNDQLDIYSTKQEDEEFVVGKVEDKISFVALIR